MAILERVQANGEEKIQIRREPQDPQAEQFKKTYCSFCNFNGCTQMLDGGTTLTFPASMEDLIKQKANCKPKG
jgi:hypothetical protein